jgi:mRNA interferase HicA
LQLGQGCPILRGRDEGKRIHPEDSALARERGIGIRLVEKRGKGSHATLYLGQRMTIVRNPKDELKSGTLHAMCRQLGVKKEEL